MVNKPILLKLYPNQEIHRCTAIKPKSLPQTTDETQCLCEISAFVSSAGAERT